MLRRLFVLRWLRRWHARLGVAAMLFFLVLSVSGVILNHGRNFGLDGRYLHVFWLARWYGIKAEAPHQAFRTGNHRLVAANGRWMLDGKAFGEKLPQAVGLVEFADMLVVASDSGLQLYRGDGELIDRLGPDALPGVPVLAIGSSAQELVLRTASGTFSSSDALSWRPAPPQEVEWSTPIELSAVERRAYEAALAPGVSVQQLLLDLHSGRLAGRYGPLIVDLLGVTLMLLSLAGAWLYFVPRRRREWH